MTQPDSIEALTAAVRNDVDAVWLFIVAEQDRLMREWWGMAPPVRANRLKELQALVGQLADQVDALAAGAVLATTQVAYEVGAFAMAISSRATASFQAVDTNTIVALAQDTMDDLLRGTQGMRESSRELVRTMSRDWVRAKIYTGMTAEQAGVRLAADLADRAITSVIYADGRRVGLSTYTDMVLRTKTALAYQEGAFNQAEALGIGWMEIFDGAGCGWTSHDDPRRANGLVVPLAEARQYPISHPNCRRSSSGRIDIESAADAARAMPSPSDAQRADQAAAEVARAEAYAKRPRRVSLDRQVARARQTNVDLGDGVLGSKAAQRHAARVAKRATHPA